MSPTDLETRIPGLLADGLLSTTPMEFDYACDGGCRDRSPKSPVLLRPGPVLAGAVNRVDAVHFAEERACILNLAVERRGSFPSAATWHL